MAGKTVARCGSVHRERGALQVLPSEGSSNERPQALSGNLVRRQPFESEPPYAARGIALDDGQASKLVAGKAAAPERAQEIRRGEV
jgi:hypothetical protein